MLEVELLELLEVEVPLEDDSLLSDRLLAEDDEVLEAELDDVLDVLLEDVDDRLELDSLVELSSSRSTTIETRRLCGCSGCPNCETEAGKYRTAGLVESWLSMRLMSHISTTSCLFASVL